MPESKSTPQKKQSRKTAIVTGASGFVGANLVRRLIQEQYDVHVLLRKEPKLWRLRDIQNKLTRHTVDITERDALIETVKDIRPSHIFHLAAYGAYSYQTELANIIHVNINGLENLLAATDNLPYTSFIVTGSSSEYGFKKKPMKETDVLEPVSYYAATKSAATLIAQAHAKLHSKPISIVRLFSVYGPYEEPTRFFPTVICNALRDKEIALTAGSIRRDFIYVDDVTAAYSNLANNPPAPGEIINLGTGKQYTNDEVVQILETVIGKKLSIKKGAYKERMWDTQYWVADNKKAKKLIDWKPQYTLKKGIAVSVRWFTDHAELYSRS